MALAPRRPPRPVIEIAAHRGASAHAPENTVAAFDLALEQGADVLELDVRPAGDGTLVLLHDPTLLRTVGDPRRVDSMAAEEIASLPHPARPATLEEVLGRYGPRARYLVDLKDPAPEWEGRVLEAIDRHGLRSRVALQSFDRGALERLRRLAPWAPLVALYRRAESLDIDLDAVPGCAHAIGPWHVAVDAPLVEAARARGLEVRPWTIDVAEEANRLLGLGVRHLITNAPDVVVAAAGRRAPLAAAA